MDPLWGPKHLRSSYFCELSLHTEFQSNSSSPSIKLFVNGNNNNNNNNKRKVNENSGNLVPSLLRKGDQSADARANIVSTIQNIHTVMYIIHLQKFYNNPSIQTPVIVNVSQYGKPVDTIHITSAHWENIFSTVSLQSSFMDFQYTERCMRIMRTYPKMKAPWMNSRP